LSRRLAIAHAISISKIYFCVSRAAVGEEEAVTDRQDAPRPCWQAQRAGDRDAARRPTGSVQRS